MSPEPHLRDACLTWTAPSPDAMSRFGAALAERLSAGDLVALTGPLGAGKSHLARAVVRAVLGAPDAEVPSPTYTLVNVYEHDDVPVWHADLYRLGDAEELSEIGLEDALGEAIVLVEWPGRWPDLPRRRLDVAISVLENETRALALCARGPNWDDVLNRLEAIR